jgi:poly(3-hydroxyalkanoate) synthetase
MSEVTVAKHAFVPYHELTRIDLPLLWPIAAAARIGEAGLELYARNLRFLDEEIKIHHPHRPELATANRIRLDLRTMALRDYSRVGATGLANGLDRVFLTDWKGATDDMKDLEIDEYLAELNVCVDELGGRVNLVGLCQGGWMSTMYAARFPHKVAKLVLAGAPIDFDAGDGPIKRMAHAYPTAFYEELVALGGGLMRGTLMLRAWKDMHPQQHYFQEHVDLYHRIDDLTYIRDAEAFANWYESPIDLPGRWYLQAIVQLFKENRLVKGRFVGMGRALQLRDITCPVYLLAGESDDITTREQLFNAEKYLGTPKDRVEKKLVPGGHIGLFMGSRTLAQTWPEIARWIAR